MKIILLSILIGLTLSYNTESAIIYAKRYCRNYNKAYDYDGPKLQNPYFVSQCLKAGGFDFKGCGGRDKDGLLMMVSNLKSCLTKKGWKSKTGLPKGFKGGYPFFNGNQMAMIATRVIGNSVTYCSHKPDTCGKTTSDNNYASYYL